MIAKPAKARRPRRVTRVLIRTALVLFMLIPLATGSAILWLRTSLPSYSGTIQLDGVGAPLSIVRDDRAVPHIFARTREDAFFGLGFVHGQDRLWQLEMARRAVMGRLAQAVGKDGLPTDKLVAALELERTAAGTHARNDPATRAAIRAYVGGINAAIASRKGALPPEFVMLGIEPERWSEDHVNRMGGIVALGFGDWREELMRARLATRLKCDRLRDLYARTDDPGPITYAELPVDAGEPAPSCGAVPFAGKAAAARALPFGRSSPASNAWAIAGTRTASGKPLLANDPHGPLSAPIDYYPVRLRWPGFELVGASRPGFPVIASGRNPYIAWGVTDMMADQSDLFVERLDPANSGRYLTPTGSEPFQTREVLIPVKGAAAQRLSLRYTRHGIVISDIDEDAAALLRELVGPGHVIALAGLAFPDGNPLIKAFLGMAEARGWSGFQAAARDFGLQQNFVFADRAGRIGMLSAGRLPRRRGDGFMPVPGWNARYDWTGHLPPESWPSSIEPGRGFIANANNRLVGGSGGSLDSAAFQPGWRAARIEAVLYQASDATLRSQAALQTDVRSAQVPALRPILQAARPASRRGHEARARLLRWDGTMSPERAEPLIWAAWQRAAGLRLLAPQMGKLAPTWLSTNVPRLERLLRPGSPWCSDCPAVAGAALDDAAAALVHEQGRDMSAWKWGRVHQATFAHSIFSYIPLLSALTTPRVPSGGDAHTVNAGQGNLWGAEPWANNYGPRYRQIIDLAAPERSLFMVAPGISGNPLSPWYAHLAEPWRHGRYFTLAGDPVALRRSGIGHLVIAPRSGR